MARWWIERHSPLGEVERLQRVMNDFFSGWGMEREPFAASQFPSVNIASQGSDFFVTAELPGVDMGTVDLSVNGNALTLKGTRKAEKGLPVTAYQRQERQLGDFVKSVRLPAPVSSEKAQATLSNGILEVRIPKAPEAQPRRIEVKTQG